MSGETALDGPFEVAVANVGGIEETTVTFDPGLTILSGRNATNRTSFLKALMAVHGSEPVPLKADAEEGHVRLTSAERTSERHFAREDGHVVSSGDPILDDPELADLFAFLLEDNEARRVGERGEDLRDVIMRPVDTEAIEAELAELAVEKDRIDGELAELDGLRRREAELETERRNVEDELDEKRAELRARREEIEAVDGDVQETRAIEAELEGKLDDLWTARSELETVEYDLETEQEGLSSLRAELEELESELDSLPETPAGDLEGVEGRLETLHDRKGSITTDLNRLQNLIQFNEEMLDGSDSELLAALGEGPTADSSGSVTDQLVAGEDSVVCWTCGQTVERAHVVDTLEDLRALRQEKLKQRNEVDEEIGRLQAERDDLRAQKRRREELERTIRRREREIERREETVEDLEARRDDLAEDVERLEATVEDLRVEEQSELLELHEAVNQLEFEIDRLQDDLADVRSELDSIDARLAEREDLEARREAVRSELQERRSRVERIEREAVEAFNAHMEAVLDRLDYANVERVWIERTGGAGTDGRFDLHVVRESGGTVYEDSIHHLSESEREVIGLTFALAGYLVHDVHETVPFMLLDSLEALDSGRIAELVEYMSEYADNVVVALLPEDAAALDEEYERITEI